MRLHASLGCLALVASLLGLAAACGAPSGTGPATPEVVLPSASAAGGPAKNPLIKATVYDATGKEVTCEAPREKCPDAEQDRVFTDKCRLAGFQVRRCGCDMLCAGNAAAREPRFYDAGGNAMTCKPADPACSPPPAKASFQDACNDKGYRLITCECEWLCTGNPSK